MTEEAPSPSGPQASAPGTAAALELDGVSIAYDRALLAASCLGTAGQR